MTTRNRPELLRKSLQSLKDCTDKSLFRLTVVDDGSWVETRLELDMFQSTIDFVLTNNQNRGLGPSINTALVHVDALKRWDTNPNPFTCYVQDDIQYSPDWLIKLESNFAKLEQVLKLGFASGIESIEHPVKEKLAKGMITKDWIRATCMFARHDYWMSMWPISRIDPETGRERGRPNDGLGSSVDWWFIRNHPNSVCKTGRTNLVIPGLLRHIGYKQSTWLKRDLPESDSDKEAMK